MPGWHYWGNFCMSEKQNGRQMLPGKLNNDYNFPNKTLIRDSGVKLYVFNIKEYNGTYMYFEWLLSRQ